MMGTLTLSGLNQLPYLKKARALLRYLIKGITDLSIVSKPKLFLFTCAYKSKIWARKSNCTAIFILKLYFFSFSAK